MLSKIIKSSNTPARNAVPYSFPEASVSGLQSFVSHHSIAEHRSAGSSELVALGGTQHASVSMAEVSSREQAAYQRGLREAEERFKEQLEALSGQSARVLEKSLAEFDQLQRRIFYDAEKQVAKLALEIAKKIVRREVRIDEQIVMAMIKVAMSYVSDGRKIKVRVNPADLKVIHTQFTRSADLESTSSPPEWVADPAIERGGFVIESDVGMVDGRLGQQFQEIEKSFFGYVQKS
jgi:flagellar assembly protein FliH